MDRNVLLALGAAQEALARRGDQRRGPGSRRRRRRLGDRRPAGDRRADGRPARARARPCVAVLHPERARRLRERPDRDLARAPRPELRAGVRVRDGLARGRGGRRDDPARRCRRGARRRHRVVHPSADPRRLLRDARARRRGRGSDEGVAAVRRDAGRLRDVGRRVHPRPRGARGREGPRRDDLRRGARLRRVERRAPHGAARSGVGRRRGDDDGGAGARRTSSPSGSATSTRTAPRRRSATRPRRARSSRSSATTRASSPSRRRSR